MALDRTQHLVDFPAIENTSPAVEWKQLTRAGRLVDAIKALRASSGLRLLEAKTTVEYYRDNVMEAENNVVQLVKMGDAEIYIVPKGKEFTIQIIRREDLGTVKAVDLLQTIANLAVKYGGPRADHG